MRIEDLLEAWRTALDLTPHFASEAGVAVAAHEDTAVETTLHHGGWVQVWVPRHDEPGRRECVAAAADVDELVAALHLADAECDRLIDHRAERFCAA